MNPQGAQCPLDDTPMVCYNIRSQPINPGFNSTTTTRRTTMATQEQMEEYATELANDIINEVWNYRDTLSQRDMYEIAQEEAAKHKEYNHEELTKLTFNHLLYC